MALVWCLTGAIPALAQEAGPIPVTEINPRAGEVTALLANLDAVSAPGPDIQAIQQGLPEASQQIQR